MAALGIYVSQLKEIFNELDLLCGLNNNYRILDGSGSRGYLFIRSIDGVFIGNDYASSLRQLGGSTNYRQQ